MDANSRIYMFNLFSINNQLLKNPSFWVWLIENMPTEKAVLVAFLYNKNRDLFIYQCLVGN